MSRFPEKWSIGILSILNIFGWNLLRSSLYYMHFCGFKPPELVTNMKFRNNIFYWDSFYLNPTQSWTVHEHVHTYVSTIRKLNYQDKIFIHDVNKQISLVILILIQFSKRPFICMNLWKLWHGWSISSCGFHIHKKTTEIFNCDIKSEMFL